MFGKKRKEPTTVTTPAPDAPKPRLTVKRKVDEVRDYEYRATDTLEVVCSRKTIQGEWNETWIVSRVATSYDMWLRVQDRLYLTNRVEVRALADALNRLLEAVEAEDEW